MKKENNNPENDAPNLVTYEALVIARSKINSPIYNKIACSISGGSDSDILLDLICKLDEEKKVKYVFFNTGLEFEATREHIDYLRKRYEVEIEEIKAKKPVPIVCKEYGLPFISKQVSQFIERLQRNNFKWENKSFGELLEEYCQEIQEEQAKDRYGEIKKGIAVHEGHYYKGCVAALRWWCNMFGEKSRFNIDRNKWLKEFMIDNPPKVRISDQCCLWAKKKPVHKWIKDNEIELNMYGVRKAEGGARSTAYKNCFTPNAKKDGVDEYRPIFWYKNTDKEEYEKHYKIKHSDCYTVYNLQRTGCAGCPFGRNFEYELKVMEIHEPKLYKAAVGIWGEIYEYTRKYKEYARKRDRKEKEKKAGYEQINLMDLQ